MSLQVLVNPKDFFTEAVEEGFHKRNMKSPPAVRQYMVGLLEHYLDARNLFDQDQGESVHRPPSTLAEMYLLAQNSETHDRVGLMKKLADRSLYISGFFGDSLERKVVDIDYYAGLGCAAYESLSYVTRHDTVAAVYRIFSQQFLDFVEVLTYISQKSMVKTDQSILRLYDRYMRTGSELAKERLIEMGVVTVSRDHLKQSKQD